MSNTLLHAEYPVEAEDYTCAGEASADIKRKLKQLGVSANVLRRVAVASYEVELNLVIHSDGGVLSLEVTPDRVRLISKDRGPGIPDLDLAGKLADALDVGLDDLVHAPPEELAEESLNGKHMFGLVTVGDKGQIVIPVRARRVFGIRPGDQLMVLGDEGKGLALMDARLFISIAEEYRNGR